MRFTIGCTTVMVIALSLPAISAEHSGKAVFDKTCKTCHGADGSGNQTANDFYKVNIPKLTSDYVQNKSDEELKRIITGGRGKMIPVTNPAMMSRRPAAPHQKKLAPEELNDVVAYVRTLKQ